MVKIKNQTATNWIFVYNNWVFFFFFIPWVSLGFFFIYGFGHESIVMLLHVIYGIVYHMLNVRVVGMGVDIIDMADGRYIHELYDFFSKAPKS